jgi:hydroxymethylglutaryl-CoA lyase
VTVASTDRYPTSIEVREVGPRDGLQNESPITVDERVWLIDSLAHAGLSVIEVGSFVRPDAVPSMAETRQVLARIERVPGVRFRALVPNLLGAQRAIEAGVDELEVVVSASVTHNRENLRMTPDESVEKIADVVELAREQDVAVDAIVATAFGCPFEGDVQPSVPTQLAERLRDVGVDTFTFADTTGMAAPPHVTALLDALGERGWNADGLGMHFHNTRNTGMANIVVAAQHGVRRFDSSIGGLGGCPFSPGATGNVPTEDVVHLVHELGATTGIDLDALIEIGQELEVILGHELPGQVLRAGPRTRRAPTSD